MIPHPIRRAILELAQLLWLLNSLVNFALTCAYYRLLGLLQSETAYTQDLRIPKHIALSFTNESSCLDLDSVADLLCWCRQLSINHQVFSKI